MIAQGVFVRDRSADPACANCFRVTAGVLEHTGKARRRTRASYAPRGDRSAYGRDPDSRRADVDGTGTFDDRTGIRFLDHMLDLVARHGGFDLTVKATGDLDVDQHHTVEDVGIAFGEAVAKALGDKRGINRAGYFVMPMDETLAVAADGPQRPAAHRHRHQGEGPRWSATCKPSWCTTSSTASRWALAPTCI